MDGHYSIDFYLAELQSPESNGRRSYHHLSVVAVFVDLIDTHLKLANGPSVMRTDRSFSNLISSAACLSDMVRKRIELTSCSSSRPLAPVARKPVTRGVFVLDHVPQIVGERSIFDQHIAGRRKTRSNGALFAFTSAVTGLVGIITRAILVDGGQRTAPGLERLFHLALKSPNRRG